MKYGRSVGRPASVSPIPVTETCQAAITTSKTKEMDRVKTTISSSSRSALLNTQKHIATAR